MQNTADNIILLIITGIGSTLLLAIAFVILHIRNQSRFFKQQQQAQQTEISHQKQLLNAVIQSQETERKRIGQDLHDDVGSALSSLRLTIDLYQPAASDAGLYQAHNQTCKAIIDQIIADVRHIAHNLSPNVLSRYGLGAALEKQAEYINQGKVLKVIINNDADAILSRLELPAATALYRVLEELLNNTIKHAEASLVKISFHISDSDLAIDYYDNGKGLPDNLPIAKGMGLQNIESRLGAISANYILPKTINKEFNFTIKYPLYNISVANHVNNQNSDYR